MGVFARSRNSWFSSTFVVAGLVLTCTVASAQPGAPARPAQTPDDAKNAAREFAEGQRAFAAGDFQRAGEEFEAAYRDKPHHAPLWNAAKSWDSAGESARAAGLYARYLREAPADAPDRDAATAALRAISTRVVKLEIHPAEGVTNVTVDGKPLEGETIYVTPGDHTIDGKKGDKHAHKDQSGKAGDVLSVLLDASDTPVVAPPPPDRTPDVAPKNDRLDDGRHGLSPIFVLVGGALTVAAAGITVWSGVDTLSQKDTFDIERSQANLDDGRAKQTRTNVLIGVTAGLAVVTGVTAIFFTDWGKKAEAPPTTGSLRAGVGAGTLVLSGSF
ncbi:MAG: hypothetical protein JWM74_3902 [Myxococcaceae bacterium]|nr:hypothetical protein [Myxococcaceae bacterium]